MAGASVQVPTTSELEGTVKQCEGYGGCARECEGLYVKIVSRLCRKISKQSGGMVCIVTKSGYTENEDFANVDVVFPCIGDPPAQNFDLSFTSSLLLEQKLA